MRYTIGVEMIPKEGNAKATYIKGIFASTGWFYEVLTPEGFKRVIERKRKAFIPIFDDAETAQTFAQGLSRAYRRDDCGPGKNLTIKSKIVRKFYPIKVDSLNFPYNVCNDDFKIKKIDLDRYGKKIHTEETYKLMALKEK